MDQLTNLIPTQLYLVTVSLVFTGMFLKQTDKVKDTYIIIILTALGIAGALAFVGKTPTAVVQGILCAAVAVYSKNFQKQIKEQLGMDSHPIVVDAAKQVQANEAIKNQEPVLGTVTVTPEGAKQIINNMEGK